MIKATNLVYNFDREFAKFNTAASKKLSLIDKLALLNKAQDIFVKNAVSLVEVNSKYRTILRVLENKEVSLKENTSEDKYDIFTYPEDKLRVIRSRALVEKENCGEKEIVLTMIQSDDLDRARSNENWRSSFAWEQILADEGNEGLYVWHEDDFGISQVLIDYIRNPQEIHAPSLKLPNKRYVDWNGVERTEDQDCEFKNIDVGRLLVDLAVMLGNSTVNDAQDYQTKVREIIEANNLAQT